MWHSRTVNESNTAPRPIGVLLVNLGTPDSPRVRDVRRFLREFLSDPRVLDMPAPARWLLLNAIILPFRPRASAAAYASIWTPEGSPLAVEGRALCASVAKALGPAFHVEIAMRYGRPSIDDAVDRLTTADVARIVLFPLFPQYSSAARGSALQRVFETIAQRLGVPPVDVIDCFYDHPGFVRAHVEVARPVLAACRPDYVLFSYHGLPERQVRDADPNRDHCLVREDCCDQVGSVNRYCYRAQCFATTHAIASALALTPDRYGQAFQSRLGRSPWLAPYTDRVLVELAERGVRRVAVLSPAFVADCLETLEEIGIRGLEQFRAAGGEELTLVPSLNAHPRWVEAVVEMVEQQVRGRSLDHYDEPLLG